LLGVVVPADLAESAVKREIRVPEEQVIQPKNCEVQGQRLDMKLILTEEISDQIKKIIPFVILKGSGGRTSKAFFARYCRSPPRSFQDDNKRRIQTYFWADTY